MVTREEYQAALPDHVYPRWRAVTVAILLSYAGSIGASVVIGMAWKPRAVAWAVVCVIAWLFASITITSGNKEIFERRRIWLVNNRIGFQRIWMLSESGELDSRLERRDHQNAQHNTSPWALYEQLGGPHPRVFLAQRNGEYARQYYGIRVRIVRTRANTDVPTVRVSYVHRLWFDDGRVYDETMPITDLLRIVNETGGYLGHQAYMRTLLIAKEYGDSCTKLEVRLSSQGREVASLRETCATLAQRLDEEKSALVHARMTASLVMDIRNDLVDIIELAGKRSTRVSDLHRALTDALGRFSRKKDTVNAMTL